MSEPNGGDAGRESLQAERQRSEDALARLREALEGVSDGVLVLDPTGKVLEANPALAAETGLTRGEIVGVSFLGLFEPPDPGEAGSDLRRIEDAIRDAAGAGETAVLEDAPLHLRVVGTARQIAVHVRVTPRYRAGRLRGANVYLRFLTEKERLQDAARAWENRYRIVFEAAGDAMALIDGAGRYLEVNDRYRAFSGYGREDLLGQPLDHGVLDPKDRQALRWWLDRLDPGKTARFEITRTRRDREHRQVDLTLTGVSIASKTCALVVERDVTARRRRQVEAEVAARVGRLLVDSLDVRAVLPAIAEQVRRLEPFSRMTVLWPDEEREGYRVFASWDLEGVGGPSAGNVLPPDAVLAEVHRHGRPARRLLPPPAEPRIDDEDGRDVPRGQLAFPLVHRAGVVGLVTLDGLAPQGEGAERGMEIVAPALAAAVENARLFRRLRESEEKFRSLVENAREVIFRRGLNGEYRYVNPVVEQALGYPPEAFYRDPELATRLIHPADRERHRDVFRGMLEGTDYPAIEFRLRHRSGKRWVWFLLSAFPLRDPAGNLVAIEGILRDITNRKEAEAASREYERRLLALGELGRRLAQERTPRGVAEEALRGLMGLFGAQGGLIAVRERHDEGLQVLVASGAGESAAGAASGPAPSGPALSPLRRAYLSGEIVEVSDLSSVPRHATWAGNLVAHGFLGTVAAPLAGGEGTRGALVLHFSRPSPLGDQGHTVLRLAASQVMTALERADQLQAAGRRAGGIDRSSRDLATISEVLARDLRAPVASLAGLAGMLPRAATGGGRQAEVVTERILLNARLLERILNGLLRLLRAGDELVTSPAVDAGAVVAAVTARHAEALAERGGTLEAAEAWPTVVASEPALREALGEILDNAVRFAGRLRPPRVRVGWVAAADPAFVEIHVEDNGRGLAPADRLRALEPFRRISESDDRPGIGLAVARRLAEGMGGELVVREGGTGGCLAVLRLRRGAPGFDAGEAPS